ncbi:MAG: replication factor C small subunit [Halobacteriota archaeon]|nr:replication factor C small subunit [Halobacteriota archaeon]
MTKDVLWTEKYRPKSLEEVMDQRSVVDHLKSYTKEGNIPNLIFFGPSGTGKTSTVYAISKELYGSFSNENMTYLDASNIFGMGKSYLKSEERFKRFYDDYKPVIEIFKEIINEYSSLAPLNTNFKIIFFNNAEYLTIDAQQALRRIIEKYNHTTRFIFATTYPSKLISPIRSRCLNLHFSRLCDESLSQLCRMIAKNEGVELTDDGINAVIYVAKGDARKAINTLQAASVSGSEVDALKVFKVTKNMRLMEVSELIEVAMDGDFLGTRDAIDRMLVDQGLSGDEILSRVRLSVLNLGVSEERMARLLAWIGDTDMNILEGLNERIHLEEMFSKFKGC